MARYFLHLRHETDETLDPEGIEYASLADLRNAVMANVRDLISGDILRTGIIDLRYRVDAENEAGEVVFSLPFDRAVRIIPAQHHAA
jgi:hypothetical protein